MLDDLLLVELGLLEVGLTELEVGFALLEDDDTDFELVSAWEVDLTDQSPHPLEDAEELGTLVVVEEEVLTTGVVVDVLLVEVGLLEVGFAELEVGLLELEVPRTGVEDDVEQDGPQHAYEVEEVTDELEVPTTGVVVDLLVL